MPDKRNVCSHCGTESWELEGLPTQETGRCRECNALLSEHSRPRRSTVAESNDTRDIKAMIGQIHAKGRWETLNYLVYFGILSLSYVVGMGVWFALFEQFMPSHVGLSDTGGDLGAIFTIVFVVVVFFGMNQIYRLLGLETPLSSIHDRVTSYRSGSVD